MPLPTLNTLSFDAELVCRLSIQPISAAQQHDTRLALRLLGAAEQTSEDPVLLRIEAKLDVCLAWLGQNARQQHGDSRLCRLGLEQFAWRSQADEPSGAATLTFYPDAHCPLPLTFPVHCQTQADGHTIASLAPALDEASADLWAHFVFRQHRRQRQQQA